jgi:hypothetical protein
LEEDNHPGKENPNQVDSDEKDQEIDTEIPSLNPLSRVCTDPLFLKCPESQLTMVYSSSCGDALGLTVLLCFFFGFFSSVGF